jgi:uncharacterized protein (DUF2252 family)
MLPWRFLNSTVVLRELLPQDLKLEMDQLTRDEPISAARYLASVVGVAHASQLDRKTRQEWQTVLSRNRSKTVDAPSWLWSSVVELVAGELLFPHDSLGLWCASSGSQGDVTLLH